MRHRRLFLILFFLVLNLSRLTYAQTDGNRLLEEIQKAYSELNYTEAEIKAKSVLENYQNFTASQLTEIHKILGLVYYSQNKPAESRRQFELVLSLNPDLSLDPLFVSPKILEFYNQIKDDWLSKNAQNTVDNPVRYVLVHDPRPAAALRSMLLPGWGQVYKGEKRKGLILSGLWGVGVIGSLATHLARQDAEDKYLSETNPAKIDSRYNTFNTYHKLRNNFLIVSAGVWIFSYIDAILKNQSGFETSGLQKRLIVAPVISSEYPRLQFQVRF